MQFTDTQKADISHMHSTYITNLARIATRRQQLLQQLQDAPQAQGPDFEELAASHEQLDAVTQKLQTCAVDENQLLLHQQTSMAMRVHISACVRQNSNFDFKFETQHGSLCDCTTAACAALASLVQNTILPAATCIKLTGCCNVV